MNRDLEFITRSRGVWQGQDATLSVVRSKRSPSPPLQGQAASDRALSGLQFQGAAFESSRQPIADKIVTAANSSAQWYETFSERMRLPPLDFAFDYITRSGRIDMDRLRTLAPRFMARYETQRAAGVDTVTDPVAPDAPGSIEIGFDRTRHRNCSAVLWDNLDRNSDKLAVTGPAGDLTYRELCARAAKWGNAFKTAGLARGSRIAFFLDDTPAYPAAFFGAVRAGPAEHPVPIRPVELLPEGLERDSGRLRGVACAELRCGNARGHECRTCRHGQRHRRALRHGPGVGVRRRRVGRAGLRRYRFRGHGLLDVLVGLDRAAQGDRPPASRHGVHASVLRLACAAAQGGRSLLLGAEDLLRLWIRQFPHISVFGGGHDRAHVRAAGSGVRCWT